MKTMRNSQMTLNAMFSHVEKLTDYLNEKWKQFNSKLKRLELKINLVLKINRSVTATSESSTRFGLTEKKCHDVYDIRT